jgi:hypothetical protein
MDADVIVVGAGLAGLVAAGELVERGNTVFVVEQENAANLGGQAFWSLAGCSSSTVPNSAGWGIHDSHELALQDWLGTAGFDRPEDYWPRQWANAYVDFAAVEKRAWFTTE